jgi:outer membrane protein insertion porin family
VPETDFKQNLNSKLQYDVTHPVPECLHEKTVPCAHRVTCLLLFALVMLVQAAFATSAKAKQQEITPRVWKVQFEGNQAYPDIVLQEVIANESVTWLRRRQFWRHNGELYSETEVRRDVVRLERFYQRRGFPNARVLFTVDEGSLPWRRHILFHIHEGRPIVIDDFSYTIHAPDQRIQELISTRAFTRLLSRNQMADGQRFEAIRISDTEGAFLSYMQDMGHAFAKVSVDTRIDSIRYSASIHVTLDPGPLAWFGPMEVEGQETVSAALIRKESGISEGQVYSRRAISRAQQEIFSHHLFRFVTISIPEQPRDTTVELSVRVREHPLRSIQVLAGAGTEDILRGGVTWMHRNPFGNAHSFTFSARASFIEQRASMDYLVPYVFNTLSSFVISPFGQRQDEPGYLLYRAGATNSFVYQYSQELAGTISYEFTRNEEILKDRSFVFRDSTQLYNQSVIRIVGFFNESSLERSEGWAIRPFYEISGFLNTGTLKYQRFSLDLRRFVDLSRTTQIALRANGGLLFTDDAGVLPSNLRYYLGGTNSVRGWGRNDLGPQRPSFDATGAFSGYVPDGGRLSLAFNTEWRQNVPFINRNFGFAVFFDGGQVWRNYANFDPADFRFGAGGGLRYQSPIGPVRFDVGYKVNPDDVDLGRYNGQDFGGRFARWGFHFSIGQAF